MDRFPFNYMRAAVDARAGFTHRRGLAIWQWVVVILVLHGLMMMPVSVTIANTQTIDLAEVMPQAMASLTQTSATEVSALTLDAGRATIMQAKQWVATPTTVVGQTPNAQQGEAWLAGRSGVVFTPERVLLAEKGDLDATPYLLTSDFHQVKTVKDLQQHLAQQWYETHRTAYNLVRLVQVSALTLLNQLFILFGAAGLLYLTRFSPLFHIASYREAVTLCLYALGLPTVVALGGSWVIHQPLAGMTIQSIAFVLMLLWSYWQTHFNDEYVEQQRLFRA